MLIGFDGSRAFEKNKTGTENYSYQILNKLLKFDTVNKYLVYLRPGNEVIDKHWPSNVKFKVLAFPRLWTQVGLAFYTFKDPIDMLFVPGHTLPLIRRPGLKTVMTVHDLGAEYLPRAHQLKQRLYLGFITKFQLKSAARLIAVSKATCDDLVRKVGIKSERIKVIYEGLNFNQNKAVKPDIQRNILKQYDINNGDYFIFIGTIQPRKNLSRLIEGYNQFVSKFKSNSPDLALGGGKGWLSDEIYALPKQLGIEKKVKFLGRVPEEQLPVLYANSVALVFPSLYEGFGLPILEAFACECPVITSNVSSMPEVGGDAAIYVDPYDTKSIASAMESLFLVKKPSGGDDRVVFKLNLKMRQKMVKKGRQQLKKFSWEKAAKETLAVLRETAGEK